MVTTRFAPSPTGRLHVGNICTALHNWMLAQISGGEFILCIDDTDAENSKGQYIDAIRADLKWLGLPPIFDRCALVRHSTKGATSYAAMFGSSGGVEITGLVGDLYWQQ